MKRFRPPSSSDDDENSAHLSKTTTPQSNNRTRLVDRPPITPARRPLRIPTSQPVDQFDHHQPHSKYKFFSGTGEPLVKADLYERMIERYHLDSEVTRGQLSRERSLVNQLENDNQLWNQRHEELKMDVAAGKDELYHQQLTLRKSNSETSAIISENQLLLQENNDLRRQVEQSDKAVRENFALVKHLQDLNERESRRSNELKSGYDNLLLACQNGQDAMSQLEKSKVSIELAMRSISAAQNM